MTWPRSVDALRPVAAGEGRRSATSPDAAYHVGTRSRPSRCASTPGYRTRTRSIATPVGGQALREDGAVDPACQSPRPPASASSISAPTTWCCRDGAGSDARPADDEVSTGSHARRRLRSHARARARGPPGASTARRRTTSAPWGLPAISAGGRTGLGIGVEELALLTRLDETIEARLRAYGRSDDRFGLVHADVRLANLLVATGHVRCRSTSTTAASPGSCTSSPPPCRSSRDAPRVRSSGRRRSTATAGSRLSAEAGRSSTPS